MFNKSLQPWFIWGSATLFVFFQFLLQTSTSVMIPAFIQEFNINPMGVGILSSSYFYSYLTLQLPAGMLVDRFGARAILTAGVVLCAFACWLFAHADNMYVAQLSRILMGLGSAPVIGTTFALVAHWFPAKRFALLIGVTDTIGMFGGAAGQAYLARWVEQVGWQQTIIGCGIAALVIAVLIGIFVRDKAVVHSSSDIQRPKAFAQVHDILKIPAIWANGVFVAMAWGVAIGFVGLWSVPFLQVQYHLSLSTAAAISSTVLFGIAAGAPVTGWLTDNCVTYRRKLMFGFTIACLITLLLVLYVPNLPLATVTVLLFLFGFGSSAYIISFTLVSELTPPTARATAMGLTNMMSIAIGAPVLQPLIGYFLKTNAHAGNLKAATLFTAHDFQIAFIVLPVCLVIGLVSVFFIPKTPTREMNENK